VIKVGLIGSTETMPPAATPTVFTEEEILEVFPARNNPVTTEKLWENLGRPNGKRALLAAAKRDLPAAFASKEEAQAAGAEPGQRSAVLLAKAAMAVFAIDKGMKPGSKIGKLADDFQPRLDEFFKLCGVTPPRSYDYG
jgi:hypothetical protein